MTAWATVEDVDNITGVDATAAKLLQAQGVVEIFAETTTEASDAGRIGTKNLRLLKRATAYQAAWMTEHPDALTNVDVKDMTQDGMSSTTAHANSGVLAPMAKRCIDRLSWKRPGSRQVLPMSILRDASNRDFARADDRRVWESM